MSAEEIIENNQRVLKVIPIKAEKDSRGISRKIPEDHFRDDYAGDVIEPPFDLFTLAVLPESSTVLGPCIDAMSVNIEGLGHRVIPRDELDPSFDEISSEIKAELAKVGNFFDNATLEGTLTQSRDKWRRDIETTGNAYVEVQMSLSAPTEPAGLTHLASWMMRLRKSDEEPTPYTVPRAVKLESGKWGIEEFPTRKYFRRFVMRKSSSSKKVYFKEWGDPRVISYRTGEVLAESWDKASEKERGEAANPVIHIKLYSPRGPYGLPRYTGLFFTIYGNRAVEVINYTTLRCNNIPALILMATNVQLTQGSINRIKEFVEERIQGDNNYSTILVIEGEPTGEGLKDPGNMKIEIKPLTETQHTDAMFVTYTKENDEKIRQAFRLPPIFIGRSDEYNRATADASRKLAEEQVFAPERHNIDSIFNTTLVPALGASSVLFKSNTPNVTDNYELTQLLAVAERSGGLSPHISRLIVEDVLGTDLPDVDPSINPHLPFTLTMLREQMLLAEEDDGTTKRFTDTEVINQLRMLKGMMSQSDGISMETRKAVDALITVMELGGVDDVMVGTKRRLTTGKKEQTEEVDKGLFTSIPTYKVDEEQRIIGGAVLVPGVVDLQGDIYDEEAVEQACYYWFENYLEDPENNGLKVMHEGSVVLDAYRPIQCYVLPEEVTFKVDVAAADEDHPSKDIDSITYPKGTWMLYARARKTESGEGLWTKYKSGELLGWSIGGVATVQQLKALGLLKDR